MVLVFGIASYACCGAWACTSRDPASRPMLEPCRLNDLSTPAQCGQLRVKENRTQPDSRMISLRFAVVPAVASTPRRDPLVILVGGPGQAATEAGGALASLFSDVRRSRDIVLVDQRGTGGSHGLPCDDDNIPFAERFSRTISRQEVRACLSAQDADTTQYATPMALDDLEAVRQHLGYASWNLWGGSYGTRVALAYMQRYPDSVRRVVLDGAAPTDLKVPLHFAQDAQRALELMYQACEQAPSCQQSFPDSRTKLAQLLQALKEQPMTVSVNHPSTGVPEQLSITQLGLTAGLRSLLYSAELTALLPLSLYQAAEHTNWAPFVTAVTALTDGMADRPSYTGMYLSVICAEDVGRVTEAELDDQAQRGFFGVEYVNQLREACEIWPSAQLPDTYFLPVTTPHPTLVLSGELDPATPPRFGELVTSRLVHARHVTMPGVGHGVSTVGCMPRVIAEFLESEHASSVQTDCAMQHQRPAFFTSFTGP